jgi:3-oxoacyl-[acyl-carrier protein] reductase
MELRMNGRNALVTGGSKGIGLAIARSFAEAGANVAIVARQQQGLDEARAAIAAAARNTKVVTVAADVGTADGCRKAYDAAHAAFGQLDVLVNNAGTSQRGPFVEISDELWQHDLDLKLFAAIRLCRLAFPGMVARRWGRIINILNVGAKAPQANGAPTAVSRAAGMALTKVLSGEGAPHNVLVNGLLVGNIESNQWVVRHSNEGKGRSLQDFYGEMGKRIPMGRVGTAQEFANMALFLASDAGSYVTGTAINIDGGLTPVVYGLPRRGGTTLGAASGIGSP